MGVEEGGVLFACFGGGCDGGVEESDGAGGGDAEGGGLVDFEVLERLAVDDAAEEDLFAGL